MQATYQDKVLTCRDCSQEFVWTSGEQEFYASKNLENAPSRCPTCRAAARAERQAQGYGGGTRQREFFPAVCGRCGVQTQVPFLPRNDKPVYCSTCFDVVRAEGLAQSSGF
jgi:CxxC-x17-CxxC domain-containing protein